MRMTRGRFLGLTAGAAGAMALPTTKAAAMVGMLRPREAEETRAGGKGGRRGLSYRSVVYEVGEGDIPATRWSAERVRRDMRAIRHELRADSVKVTGDGVERLTRTAAEAAERGLNVWLEPTLGGVPEREILDHLAETGRFAERLRRQGLDVHLSVGCEFLIFLPGIVPGDDILERIENLLAGNFDPVEAARRVHDFTARAAGVARSVFHGPLTYAAAEDEEVDWDLFDIVGLDYYGYHRGRSAYIRDLRRHVRPGKPLSIQEFGCCTFEGAPQDAGMGWSMVDFRAEPPRIKGDLKRSERVQAAYVTDVLAAFEAMGLYAAHAFTFISPDSPHRPDAPRYDLDMASYALVKPLRDRPDDPESDWHWEPKQSFHALAGAYGRAVC
ncbi:abortive phage infection protein [Streptomyces ipomoeae]|nr:abortive phage infection protein [Streptomyces ipomoeae]MDX2935403.1 abortive phage infection protein [Streptomyces ipomoeae]TQE19997.1 abortive phage infection protein [Streptomyces ipomoeae]